jgi:hypothetical protein
MIYSNGKINEEKGTASVLFSVYILMLILSVVFLGLSSVISKTNAQLLLGPSATDMPATQQGLSQQYPAVAVCPPISSQQLQLPPIPLLQPPTSSATGLSDQLPPIPLLQPPTSSATGLSDQLPPIPLLQPPTSSANANATDKNQDSFFNQPLTNPPIPAANASSSVLNQPIHDTIMTSTANEYLLSDNRTSQSDRSTSLANNTLTTGTTTTTETINVQNNTPSPPQPIITKSDNATNPSSSHTKDNNNTTILLVEQSTSNNTNKEKFNNIQDRSLFLPNNTTTAELATSSDNQDVTCDLEITPSLINEMVDTELHQRMTALGSLIELNENAFGASCDPTLAMSDNNIYVAMTEGNEEDREILLKRSTDGGNTFSEMIPISDGIPSAAFNPHVAVSEKNVYVVWQDENPDTGVHDIYLRKSIDGGNTFSDIINVSQDHAGSGDPYIYVHGKKVFVTWDGTSPEGNGIFFSQSRDGGNTFSNTVKLSNGQGIPFLPKVEIVSGNNIEIVWLNSLDGNNEILSRKSVDAGVTFNKIQKLSNDLKDKIWTNNN